MPSVHDQIITNSNITNATRAQNQSLQNKGGNSSIGSDEFLFLLTQQLQYQDPMNPMDNTEMLAQEAQFATLEQMEGLANSFSKFSNMYQANSLLGQTVGVSVNGGKEIIGKVDFADYSDTKGASVSIGGTMYPLDSITKVYPPETKPDNGEKPNEEDKNIFKTAINTISDNVGKISKAILNYENTKTPEITDMTINKDNKSI